LWLSSKTQGIETPKIEISTPCPDSTGETAPAFWFGR
jgi:hypothetical protein